MKILKNILLLAAVFIVTFILSSTVGKFYFYLFPAEKSGGILSLSDDAVYVLRGLSLSYIFFLAIFFIIFGDTKKYWWIGFALIPAVLFEVAFDLRHIYFPIIIGLIGWALGKGIEFAIIKYRHK